MPKIKETSLCSKQNKKKKAINIESQQSMVIRPPSAISYANFLGNKIGLPRTKELEKDRVRMPNEYLY